MDLASIGRYWSEDSANYGRIISDELSSFRRRAWRERFAALLPGGALDVLDFGCGPGFFSQVLADLGHRVTGADLSEGMIREARARLAAEQDNPRFVQIDGTLDAFADASFDLVVSRNVTWTLQEPEAFYRQARRVLRPAGMLLVYDANWHLPLFDGALLDRCRRREAKCLDRYGSTFDGDPIGEPFDPLELPLSGRKRPAWDVPVLHSSGFRSVSTSENIIETLWDEKEKLLYGETPLFEIVARA